MSLKLRGNKRPNYFTGQLLGQDDFLAEQKYHVDLQRSHARLQHTWGIVMGLEVSSADKNSLLVLPGTALDMYGRLIVLDTAQTYPVAALSAGSIFFLTASYDEGFDPADRSADDADGFTRCSELCILRDTMDASPSDGSVIILARVQFKDGRLDVDTSVRAEAGARLARQSIQTTHLADGAITLAKLAAELRGGWVRTPFKPSSFAGAIQGGPNDTARDFTIGVTKTYCEERGATGTMAIQIPILADRISNFMIAGETNDKGITIELDLCGWDSTRNQHEKITLLETRIEAKSPFHQTFVINKSFDRTRHGLALYVAAAGKSSVSIVAAQFESSLAR